MLLQGAVLSGLQQKMRETGLSACLSCVPTHISASARAMCAHVCMRCCVSTGLCLFRCVSTGLCLFHLFIALPDTNTPTQYPRSGTLPETGIPTDDVVWRLLDQMH